MSTVDHLKILDQIETFVQTFFDQHPDKRLRYHNIENTRAVANFAAQIASHYQLTEDDTFAVCAAAWFHDTGYVISPKGHEQQSVQIATGFFKGIEGVDGTLLEKITGCILATRMPQKPTNELEDIICDADLFHLGSDDFGKYVKQMRQEVSAFTNEKIKKDDWLEKNIEFLQQHHYHTDYCRELLEPRKQENLNTLLAKVKPSKRKGKYKAQPLFMDMNNTMDPGKTTTPNKKLSKGVETMFRVTAGNQQRLSNMADSKAHIMISVNAIIISLLLSLLLRKIEDHPHELIPAMLLLAVNLVTIVFSILATRPNVTLGTFTHQDVMHRNVNLLFFGNFYKMQLNDYTESMLDMMNDNDFLYKSLIRDVYAQGVVLGRKYFLLRIAYNVFMYGLVVSVIAFVIATLSGK